VLNFLRKLFGLSVPEERPGAPPAAACAPATLAPADLLLDVECVDSLLYLVLVNLGGEPALDVRVELLDHQAGALHALGGELDLAEHPLFRRLSMLRGGKQLRVLLDPAPAWFQRGLDGRFSARLTWRDRAGAEHAAQYAHDLDAFRVGIDVRPS